MELKKRGIVVAHTLINLKMQLREMSTAGNSSHSSSPQMAYTATGHNGIAFHMMGCAGGIAPFSPISLNLLLYY